MAELSPVALAVGGWYVLRRISAKVQNGRFSAFTSNVPRGQSLAGDISILRDLVSGSLLLDQNPSPHRFNESRNARPQLGA